MARIAHGASGWGRVRTTIAAVGCSAALAIAGFGVVGAGTAAAAPAAAAGEQATACPQTTANQKFVRWIYLQILFRCPDSGGLAFWTSALDGGMPRATFTDAIDMSTENIVQNNIIPDFEGVLDRDPSDSEIATWLPKMRAEHSDADLIASLASSDEYWNGEALADCDSIYSGDLARANIDSSPDFSKVDCWLEDLYYNILDRGPDDTGMAYFESLLGPNPNQAQRYNVAYNYFERSEENARSWVLGGYYAAFDRPPDSGGAEFWYHWIINNNYMTFKMWTLLLASDESYGIAQQQFNPPAAAKHADRLAEARKALS
jgi:hypothetical protein